MKSLLKKIFRFVIYAVLACSIAIGLATLGVTALLDYQDRNYAREVFSSMSVEDVLETRRWLPIFEEGCTYAVVSLKEASPTPLPIERTDWNRTPIRFKDEEETRSLGECRNLVCKCESEWMPETYQRITRALNEPGSFYYFHRGSTPPHDRIYQDIIHIYSPTERIAAQVRCGD